VRTESTGSSPDRTPSATVEQTESSSLYGGVRGAVASQERQPDDHRQERRDVPGMPEIRRPLRRCQQGPATLHHRAEENIPRGVRSRRPERARVLRRARSEYGDVLQVAWTCSRRGRRGARAAAQSSQSHTPHEAACDARRALTAVLPNTSPGRVTEPPPRDTLRPTVSASTARPRAPSPRPCLGVEGNVKKPERGARARVKRERMT